jgi:hypothetical protein
MFQDRSLKQAEPGQYYLLGDALVSNFEKSAIGPKFTFDFKR